MGERRHKDEVDSADDSDGARAEQEEVRDDCITAMGCFKKEIVWGVRNQERNVDILLDQDASTSPDGALGGQLQVTNEQTNIILILNK